MGAEWRQRFDNPLIVGGNKHLANAFALPGTFNHMLHQWFARF